MGDSLKNILEFSMQISQKGIELIKEFEGFRNTAYLCPAHVWTIGYGSTYGVKRGMKISKEEAEELLKNDIKWAERAVLRNVRVEMTQGIFDALVSFVFNCGESAFRNSTLLKLLNSRKYAEAADQLLRWNKAGQKVLEGLTRRRMAERKLFYSEAFPKVS